MERATADLTTAAVPEARRIFQEIALKYLPPPIDGIFGPMTESAVRAYQTQQNIAIDGVMAIGRGGLASLAFLVTV